MTAARTRRARLLRGVIAGLLGAALAAFLVLRFSPAWFLAAPPAGKYECVDGYNPTPPADIHLQPGFVEHQSWIDFNIRSEPKPTIWAVCVDGREITQVPERVGAGTVRFSIQTRVVNMLWIGGRLAEYETPEHWTLYYETCARAAQGTIQCS